MIHPCYHKGERGNKPYDLELMLRIYMLQTLYNLSDMATVTEMIDSRAFSNFCGVDSSNQVPGGDTLGRFRHILKQNGIQQKLFAQVVTQLTDEGLILKKGTIVDFTIIAAPPSTKNKERERDSDARQVKEGNAWHFGYKSHIGVDKDSGLVHTVEVTGAGKREDDVVQDKNGKRIRYKINPRLSQSKTKSVRSQAQIKHREHEKSSVRAKVEHVFGVVKEQQQVANLILADRPCLAV